MLMTDPKKLVIKLVEWWSVFLWTFLSSTVSEIVEIFKTTKFLELIKIVEEERILIINCVVLYFVKCKK